MRILERTVYIGANVYAHYPVIRLLIDLGPLERWPSARLGSSFIEPLVEALPGLATHGCSYSVPGGFIRRLREDGGTWIGHILEHVALELQHVAGAEVAFGKTRSTGEKGRYHIVYAYEDPDVGVQAGLLAERLLRSLIPQQLHLGEAMTGFDFQRELDELVALADQRRDDADLNGHAGGTTGCRVVVLAGVRDLSYAAVTAAERLGATGASVGVAGAFGARVGSEMLAGREAAGARAERAVLGSGVDVAIFATTPELIVDTGLAVTRCDVAAVQRPALDDRRDPRDPLQLPMEIAGRSVVVRGDSSPSAIADAVVDLLGEQ